MVVSKTAEFFPEPLSIRLGFSSDEV